MRRVDVLMWLWITLAVPAGAVAVGGEQEDASAEDGTAVAAEPAAQAPAAEPDPPPPGEELQTLVFTTEVSLRPPAGAAAEGGAFVLERQCASCEIKCFTHSCKIDCPTGRPDCICRQVDTKTGKQWIPFCNCR